MARYKTVRLEVDVGPAEAGGYRAYVQRVTTHPESNYRPILVTKWFKTKTEAERQAQKYVRDYAASGTSRVPKGSLRMMVEKF